HHVLVVVGVHRHEAVAVLDLDDPPVAALVATGHDDARRRRDDRDAEICLDVDAAMPAAPAQPEGRDDRPLDRPGEHRYVREVIDEVGYAEREIARGAQRRARGRPSGGTRGPRTGRRRVRGRRAGDPEPLTDPERRIRLLSWLASTSAATVTA